MSFEAPSQPLGATTEPHARFLSTSCLDFLIIELVPMAERLSRDLLSDDTKQPDDEENREATFFRLESLGYRVGQGLTERFVLSYSWLTHLLRYLFVALRSLLKIGFLEIVPGSLIAWM